MGQEEDQKLRNAGNIPTVETWDDADCKLQVTQPEGWTCKACLTHLESQTGGDGASVSTAQ